MINKIEKHGGKRPIVANETEEFGLYIGPKGGYGKVGLSCKSQKWSYLFTEDESDTPHLLNVVNYLKSQGLDAKDLDWHIQKFITAYQEWRKTNAA